MTIYSTVLPTENPEYRIFPLSHNFAQPINEAVEFKTDIIESSNGKEQRRAVRDEARRTITQYYTFDEKAKWALDRFMYVGRHRPALIADERSLAYTVAPMAPDAMSVAVKGPTGFATPGSMVLISDGVRKETRTVAGSSAGTISFSDKTITAFPAKSRVSPVRLGFLDPSAQSQRLTNNAGTISFTFEIEPGNHLVTGDGSDTIIDGMPYWTFPPNWNGSSEVQYMTAVDKVDYGYGRTAFFNPIKYSTRLTKHEFLSLNRTAALALLSFFVRRRGRQGEFLFSTGESDIPYYALAGGSFSVLVDGEQFAYDFGDNTVFRRVLFRRRNRQDFSRLIDYLEPLPDTSSTAMWLTQALPTSQIAPADIFGASWCNVSRFASDRLELEWVAPGVARSAIQIQSLENFEL